jgi:hypothetical protein
MSSRIVAYVTPVAGSAAEHVQKHGLASLRGVPLLSGDKVLYISDSSLDAAIALWSDEPDDLRLRMESRTRLYGAERRNDNMVAWIYLNSVTVMDLPHAPAAVQNSPVPSSNQS